ncbi:MAG: hypothetical protein KDE04_25815, partial [Anaerolineales bacterium]|nr:hypothetical protein [Anaerolineales bacterium]
RHKNNPHDVIPAQAGIQGPLITPADDVPSAGPASTTMSTSAGNAPIITKLTDDAEHSKAITAIIPSDSASKEAYYVS